MTKLKPCLFCGGEALLNEFPVRKGYEASIQCDGGGYCFALMTTITYDFPMPHEIYKYCPNCGAIMDGEEK